MRRRKCRSCREWFKPQRENQLVCSPPCALEHAKAGRRKRERKELKKAKERLKTRKEWMGDLQTSFNAYIRERDQNRPCISCGRFHSGQMHAGHYRAVGAGGASPLRFNEINVHAQCAPCNNHQSGNVVEYRINLAKRIGVELVEWLEQDHPPLKLTIPQIRALIGYYRNAVKVMRQTACGDEPF